LRRRTPFRAADGASREDSPRRLDHLASSAVQPKLDVLDSKDGRVARGSRLQDGANDSPRAAALSIPLTVSPRQVKQLQPKGHNAADRDRLVRIRNRLDCPAADINIDIG
jgi:hypothetical protein